MSIDLSIYLVIYMCVCYCQRVYNCIVVLTAEACKIITTDEQRTSGDDEAYVSMQGKQKKCLVAYDHSGPLNYAAMSEVGFYD